MVWQIPGDKPITTPIEIAVKGDPRPMEEQLADLGTYPRARVDVPVTSQQALREIAELLRELSTSLAVLGRRTDMAEKTALFHAAWEIKATNRKVQALQPKKKGSRDSMG